MKYNSPACRANAFQPIYFIAGATRQHQVRDPTDTDEQEKTPGSGSTFTTPSNERKTVQSNKLYSSPQAKQQQTHATVYNAASAVHY